MTFQVLIQASRLPIYDDYLAAMLPRLPLNAYVTYDASEPGSLSFLDRTRILCVERVPRLLVKRAATWQRAECRVALLATTELENALLVELAAAGIAVVCAPPLPLDDDTALDALLQLRCKAAPHVVPNSVALLCNDRPLAARLLAAFAGDAATSSVVDVVLWEGADRDRQIALAATLLEIVTVPCVAVGALWRLAGHRVVTAAGGGHDTLLAAMWDGGDTLLPQPRGNRGTLLRDLASAFGDVWPADGPGPAPRDDADQVDVVLCMIVRDEAHVLRRTLQNVASAFPLVAWVLADTGSTDGTPEVAERFFAERGIPGAVYHHPWVDFAANRNRALALARAAALAPPRPHAAPYVLVFDADDRVVGAPTWPPPPSTEFSAPAAPPDVYMVPFRERGAATTTFYRPLLVRAALVGAEFRGVLHEFLHLPAHARAARMPGTLRVHSGRAGGVRGFNPRKYLDDAALLRRALGAAAEPGGAAADPFVLADPVGAAIHYGYYLGQSLYDAHDFAGARAALQAVVDLGDGAAAPPETRAAILLLCADMAAREGDDFAALCHWLDVARAQPGRLEGVVRAARCLAAHDLHALVCALLAGAARRQTAGGAGGAECAGVRDAACYDLTVEELFIVSAFRCGEAAAGRAWLGAVLARPDMTPAQAARFQTLVETNLPRT